MFKFFYHFKYFETVYGLFSTGQYFKSIKSVIYQLYFLKNYYTKIESVIIVILILVSVIF